MTQVPLSEIEDILELIFHQLGLLDPKCLFTTLPLVCKSWNSLLKVGGLYDSFWYRLLMETFNFTNHGSPLTGNNTSSTFNSIFNTHLQLRRYASLESPRPSTFLPSPFSASSFASVSSPDSISDNTTSTLPSCPSLPFSPSFSFHSNHDPSLRISDYHSTLLEIEKGELYWADSSLPKTSLESPLLQLWSFGVAYHSSQYGFLTQLQLDYFAHSPSSPLPPSTYSLLKAHQFQSLFQDLFFLTQLGEKLGREKLKESDEGTRSLIPVLLGDSTCLKGANDFFKAIHFFPYPISTGAINILPWNPRSLESICTLPSSPKSSHFKLNPSIKDEILKKKLPKWPVPGLDDSFQEEALPKMPLASKLSISSQVSISKAVNTLSNYLSLDPSPVRAEVIEGFMNPIPTFLVGELRGKRAGGFLTSLFWKQC